MEDAYKRTSEQVRKSQQQKKKHYEKFVRGAVLDVNDRVFVKD